MQNFNFSGKTPIANIDVGERGEFMTGSQENIAVLVPVKEGSIKKIIYYLIALKLHPFKGGAFSVHFDE